MFSPLLMGTDPALRACFVKYPCRVARERRLQEPILRVHRVCFFRTGEESCWQSIYGNLHFWQEILAMLSLQSLPFELKKWQGYLARYRQDTERFWSSYSVAKRYTLLYKFHHQKPGTYKMTLIGVKRLPSRGSRGCRASSAFHKQCHSGVKAMSQ